MTEVFEWQSSGRGPHYRITLDDSSLSIETNGQPLTINLDEIKRLYVQPYYSLPVSHMLNVEVVDSQGKGVMFHDSGFGIPDSDARACKNAASALVHSIAARQSKVKIYQGQSPDKPGRFVIAGLILLGVIALVWATLHYVFDKPDHAKGLAILLSACLIFGTFWSARKARRQPAISSEDLLEVLERL